MAESPLSPLVPPPTPPEQLANGYPHLTPTEQRIIDLLKDGKPHDRKELIGLLGDDQASNPTISVHLKNVRKKIAPHGKLIIPVFIDPDNLRRVGYQLCRVR